MEFLKSYQACPLVPDPFGKAVVFIMGDFANRLKDNFPRIPFEAEEVNFEPPQPTEGALEDFLHILMDGEGDREG